MKTNFSRSSVWCVLISTIILIGLAGCDSATNPIEDTSEPEPNVKLTLNTINPGDIIQVTSDPADQTNPDFSVDRVVYDDNRNGNSDIYTYCLKTGTETRITSDPSDQFDPNVSNGQIVWVDERVESGQDIFFLDLADMQEVQLSNTAEPYNDNNPEITGDYVIWHRGFQPWLYSVYVVSEDTTFSIEITGPGDGGYGISGDRLAITGYDLDDTSSLWLCDLSGQTEDCEYLLDGGSVAYPDIDGDHIVWQDDRNGNNDIFLYDLATNTETQITSNSAEQRSPLISGNYIVWVDTRNGNDDIFLYNLETQTETQLTTDSSDQRNPSLYGNYIVWEDNRNGNWDIFLYEIPGNE
ncbi:MAG TPA: hypothetical protein VF181_00990 [Balneolaceae bacterium]